MMMMMSWIRGTVRGLTDSRLIAKKLESLMFGVDWAVHR
jgi:hypothetical protein